MNHGLDLLAFVAATAVMGSPALAASEPAAPTGLSLTATGDILYDSNQLRNSANTNHKDDIRYSPAGSLEYGHLLGRASVVLSALVGYDFYQYNKYLDGNRLGAGGVVTVRAGARCMATVNGNFTQRQNGTYESGAGISDNLGLGQLPPDNLGRVIDNQQTYLTYGANANCGSPGGRLSFGGAASHSSLDNASPFRSFSNSNSDAYSLFAGIGLFRPGQLQANVSFSTIDYPNQLRVPGETALPVGVGSGVKTYNVGLTYSRPIGSRLTGSFGLSYLTARPSGGQAPYNAPAYNVSLTYQLGSRMTLSALGSRSVLSSSGYGALFRVVDTGQFSLAYNLTPRINVHANAGLVANSYKLPFSIQGVPAHNRDSLKIVGLGLNFTPRGRYDAGVYVGQAFATSDVSFLNYSSTSVSFKLTVHV